MIGSAEEVIKWLFNQDKEARYEIKVKRKGRSINANNYAWRLMSEIASVTKISKEEVYEEMLKNYGADVLVDDEIVKISSRKELVSSEELHIGFIGSSELKGVKYYHYRLIKGSSRYDTKEMAVFIDGIIYEAQNLGIDTITPKEKDDLLKKWEEIYGKY